MVGWPSTSPARHQLTVRGAVEERHSTWRSPRSTLADGADCSPPGTSLADQAFQSFRISPRGNEQHLGRFRALFPAGPIEAATLALGAAALRFTGLASARRLDGDLGHGWRKRLAAADHHGPRPEGDQVLLPATWKFGCAPGADLCLPLPGEFCFVATRMSDSRLAMSPLSRSRSLISCCA